MKIKVSQGTALIENHKPNSGSPVLFVHGFNSSSNIWFDHNDGKGFVTLSSENGYDPWTLDLSDPISGDIIDLAIEDLHKAIRYIIQKKQQKIKLVCHSMGGLLARIITTENLLPEVPGFLSTPHLEDVTLLATPNHGYSPGGLFGRLDPEWIKSVENLLKSLGWESFQKSFQRPFFQMLRGTNLLTKLNKQPCLCPYLKWRNGIALEDIVVPAESAMFGETEIHSVPEFDQKLFHACHMDTHKWQNLSSELIEWLKRNFGFEFEFLSYPPIYRKTEVAEWIFE